MMVWTRIGLAALTALVASIALTALVRALGHRRRLLDGAGASGHAKPAVRAVPNIGGIAIFWAVAIGIAVGLGGWMTAGARELAIVMAAALGLHIVGLIDDRRPLGPASKLIAQIFAGLVPPVVLGVRSLELLDPIVGGPWASIAITAVWFVVVINAINFMDNMDGIAASCAGIAALMLCVIAMPHGPIEAAILSAALAGACAGFLVFNAPYPRKNGAGASIFMGDSGSLVVGFLVAYAAVRVSYVENAATARVSAVFVPLCILAIPLYDLVAVCAIRVVQGKSPMVGDQQHFTHRLRKRGLSDGRVCAVVAGCAAITAIAGLILTRVDTVGAWMVAAQIVLMLCVIALFERGAAKASAAR